MSRSITLSTIVALTAAAAAVLATPAAADSDPGADTTAPTISRLALLPQTVDVSAGDGDALLDLRITDSDDSGAPGSGFDHGTVTLSNGSAALDPIDFNFSSSVNGRPTDATYDVDIPVPQSTPAGTYRVSAITLADADGNAATTSDSTATLTVLSNPDTTKPALVGTVTASPTAVDVTKASRTVTYSAHLTDDLTGVADATLYATRPDGYEVEVDLARSAGTARDGTWTGTATYAPLTDRGVYTPTELVVDDAAGNTLDTSSGLGGAVTVTRTDDLTGPALVSVKAATATADVTTGDATVNVVVHATDALSGMSSGELVFSSPDRSDTVYADAFPAAPSSGSVLDGTWTVPVTFPARSAAGTWTLTSATLVDAQGNNSYFGQGDGPLPTLRIAVTDTADRTAPVLTSLTLGPAHVSTLYGDGTAAVTGHLAFTDDVSGLAGATITFRNPAGTIDDASTVTVPFTPTDPGNTGTSCNGSLAFAAALPPVAGTWTVGTVTLTDLAGNAKDYSGTDLGPQPGIVVDTTTLDTQSPGLTSLAFSPTTVDTTSGAEAVTLLVGATDPDTSSSGIADLDVTVTSPSGRSTADFALDPDALPVSGDGTSGTFALTQTLGQYVEPGTWRVTAVHLDDGAGNATDLSGTDLGTALHGSVPTLVVTSAADSAAPSPTAVTVDAGPVDVSGGNPVVVHVSASDGTRGSGVASAQVTLAGPNGRSATGSADLDTPALAGSVDVPVTVPAYNTAGTWAVAALTLTDAAGNAQTYTAGAIGGLPGNRTVTVTAASDSTAPAAAGLALTPGAVDTTNGPVDTEVLVHLTDAASGVASADLAARSPQGLQSPDAPLLLIAGTARDGWWQGTLPITHYVDAGTWTVGPLTVTDAAGNTTTLGSADLGPAGTLTVTGPAPTTPAAPTPETVMLSGATSAALTWTPPGDDGGLPITGYVVTPVDGGVAQPSTTLAPGSSGTVTGLAKGHTYTFTIAATNALGTGAASAASDALAIPATAPNAPTNVVAVPGATGTTSIAVSWTAPTDLGGTSFYYYTVTGTPGGSCRSYAAATTTCTVTGVTPGTPYSFTVTATNAKGTSPVSDPSAVQNSPVVRPGAPTIGTATLSGPTSATVSWTPPAATGGAPITGYVVTPYVGTSAKAATTVGVSTSAQVLGLAKGSTYTFTVMAVNDPAGKSSASAASNAVAIPTTVPSAPGIGAVTTSGATGAVVRWTTPTDAGGTPITGYTITPYLGPVAQPATTVTGGTSTTVTGLTKGATYTFTVTATNAVGTSPASAPSTSVTMGTTAPGAPTIGSATLTGATTATVTWTAPADTGGTAITGYVVTPYVGTTAQTAVPVGVVTSTAITGLAKSKTYTFTVAAVSAAGTGTKSAASAAVTVPMTVPGAPAIGAVSLSAPTSAVVHWSAPADAGGTTITGYVVTPYLGRTAQPATVAPSGTSVTVTGLAKGATYTFTVSAQNSVGTGAASDASTALLVPATVPGAPAIGTVTAAGPTSATVTWTAPADTGGAAITGYTVTPYLGTSAQPPTAVTGPATSATVGGLAKGRSYTFAVAATNSVGTGAKSAVSTALAIPTTAPSAPAVTAVTPSGATGVTVQWAAPADPGGTPITGYAVTGAPGGSCTTAGTSCTVSGLMPATAYTFTVTATNAVGTGPASAPSAAVTTGSVAPGAPTIGTATATGPTTAVVTWTAPANTGGAPITGYVVTPYSGGSARTPVAVAVGTSATITGLTTGTAYTFTVAAKNSAGTGAASAASNSVVPTTPPPGAPTGVTAAAGNGSVTLTWTAPAANGSAAVTGYTVTGTPGGSCTATTTTCTVTGLTNGTAYTFTVTARTATQTGAASTPSAAVTPRAPTTLSLGSAPASVVYGGAVPVKATLTRSDTKAAVAGQSVALQYRAKGSKSAFTTAATATTSTTGAVSFTSFKPGYSVELRLVSATAGAYLGATSSSATVNATRKVTLGSSAKTARSGRTFTISGTVSPHAAIGVYLQRYRSGTWSTVASGKSRSAGTYSFTVHATTRGTFAYRVYTRADSHFTTSISGTQHVKIS